MWLISSLTGWKVNWRDKVLGEYSFHSGSLRPEYSVGINGGGVGCALGCLRVRENQSRSLYMGYLLARVGQVQCSPTQNTSWEARGRGSRCKKGGSCGNGNAGPEVQREKWGVALNREISHKGKSIRIGNTQGFFFF